MSSAAPSKQPSAAASGDLGFTQEDFDALLIEAVKKKQYEVVALALEQSASWASKEPPFWPSTQLFG